MVLVPGVHGHIFFELSIFASLTTVTTMMVMMMVMMNVNNVTTVMMS